MISTDKRLEVAERLHSKAECTALYGNVKYAEQFRDELIDLVGRTDRPGYSGRRAMGLLEAAQQSRQDDGSDVPSAFEISSRDN